MMATAAAVSPSWVSDTWMTTSARVLGHGSAEPDLGPSPHVGHHLDIPVDAFGQHRALREPRTRPRLDDGSLAAQRAARCRAASELLSAASRRSPG